MWLSGCQYEGVMSDTINEKKGSYNGELISGLGHQLECYRYIQLLIPINKWQTWYETIGMVRQLVTEMTPKRYVDTCFMVNRSAGLVIYHRFRATKLCFKSRT